MWIDILGTALLHSTWQFTLIGLALYLILQIIPSRASHARYLAASTALASSLGVFLLTMVWASPETIQSVPGPESAVPAQSGVSLTALMVTAWLCGAVGILGYNLMALLGISRLRARATAPITDDLISGFDHLKRLLGVPKSTALRLSDMINVPCTFGVLKPIVLMPVALVTRLSQEEIDAVLAHELAHIRRYDYLVNIIQQAILSALYYHPAVHYISREIDQEREKACDDLAARATGHPRDLASALGKITLFAHAPTLALSAMGCDNDVAGRMARLVHPAATVRKAQRFVKVVTTAIAAGGVILFANLAIAYAQGPQAELTAEQSANLRSDICKQVKRDGYYRQSGFTNDGMVRVKMKENEVTLNGVKVPQSQSADYIKIIKKHGVKLGIDQYIDFNSSGSDISIGQESKAEIYEASKKRPNS